MESGWLVNSILSKSEDSAASRPDRSYQISPIAPPSWRALLQGRKSKMPQGLGRADARACSTVTEYPHVHTRQRLSTWSGVEIPEITNTGCESWSCRDGSANGLRKTVSAVSAANRLVTRSDRSLLDWRVRIDGLFGQSKCPQTRRLFADRLAFSLILRLGLLAVLCPLQLLECRFGPSAIFRNVGHCNSVSASEWARMVVGRITVKEREESARSAGCLLRMDGRQQEQRNEQDCPCRHGKVRCLHNHIGNSTAFRHDNFLRLEIDFPPVAVWSQ